MKILAILPLVLLSVVDATYSRLWGKGGELFDESVKGRLLDWSFAGYKAGEQEIVIPSKTSHDLTTYLIRFNGNFTLAVKKALANMKARNSLWIPPNSGKKYILEEPLRISKAVTIVGAGSDLVTIEGQPTVDESLFHFQGVVWPNQDLIGTLDAGNLRGDKNIVVTATKQILIGEWYGVVLSTKQLSARRFMSFNFNMGIGCDTTCSNQKFFKHVSRVLNVKSLASGKFQVTLERALPWNITNDLSPLELYKFNPTMNNFGLSGMSIQYKTVKYAGHWKETGLNPIEFEKVSNAWISDIKITDADDGIKIFDSYFITVQNVKISASPTRKSIVDGLFGHHGIWITGNDVLVQRINLTTMFYHDISVESSSMAFIRNVDGVDMNLEHHRSQNYGSLWTNINVGRANRVWYSGGSAGKGFQTGSLTTFWNIQGDKPFAQVSGRKIVTSYFGPALNFVGLRTDTVLTDGLPWIGEDERADLRPTWYIETIEPKSIYPPDLYVAMFAVRMKKAPIVVSIPASVSSTKISATIPATSTSSSKRVSRVLSRTTSTLANFKSAISDRSASKTGTSSTKKPSTATPSIVKSSNSTSKFTADEKQSSSENLISNMATFVVPFAFLFLCQ